MDMGRGRGVFAAALDVSRVDYPLIPLVMGWELQPVHRRLVIERQAFSEDTSVVAA